MINPNLILSEDRKTLLGIKDKTIKTDISLGHI